MGANILVVDDEIEVVKAWATALRIAGHSVRSTIDPLEAIKICTEHPIEIIILDYLMPQMTGIELLNKIREHHPHIRAVMISGKLDSGTTEEEIRTILSSGVNADTYLHKPVDNAKLKAVVATLLSSPTDRDWQKLAQTQLTAVKSAKIVKATERAVGSKSTKKK